MLLLDYLVDTKAKQHLLAFFVISKLICNQQRKTLLDAKHELLLTMATVINTDQRSNNNSFFNKLILIF